ncbi:MAG: hypothetical protein COW27_04215 [Nitrosopumilales archaeon CG15_BIG_FIL_POST_REV_8_21_14_020_37_12]|nr:MAG: hypothetical protein COW27_04215 [Nitrosopumilales archaeon CG15_BIG_FIL_POST_REV_8_21_14_020_37_12]
MPGSIDQKIFLKRKNTSCVLYHFELQLAGVILLSAMTVGGISLWLKRRKARQESEHVHNDESASI